MTMERSEVEVRATHSGDISEIIELSRVVYPESIPWSHEQLESHLSVFPQGQFVAVESPSGRVVGTAASLIVLWDDYDTDTNWRDFTAGGYFTNHDAERGRTLYGAEVMVHPDRQGRGIGKRLYKARRELVERLGLLRIRAGARLRGYHRHAAQMSPREYVLRVTRGEIGDPTLSFQLHQGFVVIAVVSGYLRRDPESLGYAAVIEWLNPLVAKSEDYAAQRVFHDMVTGNNGRVVAGEPPPIIPYTSRRSSGQRP
jgi:GNAT superfamily N-acetyltransferase